MPESMIGHWSCAHTRGHKNLLIGMIFFITDCGKKYLPLSSLLSTMQENTRGSNHPHGPRGGGWWKTKPLVKRGWCETSKEVWSKPPWGYGREGWVQHNQQPCGWGTTSYIWLRLLSDHHGKIIQMIIIVRSLKWSPRDGYLCIKVYVLLAFFFVFFLFCWGRGAPSNQFQTKVPFTIKTFNLDVRKQPTNQ